ncbi:hypothetical protein BH11ARM1_BH11ARM1_09250 [soil metagenome]
MPLLIATLLLLQAKPDWATLENRLASSVVNDQLAGCLYFEEHAVELYQLQDDAMSVVRFKLVLTRITELASRSSTGETAAHAITSICVPSFNFLRGPDMPSKVVDLAFKDLEIVATRRPASLWAIFDEKDLQLYAAYALASTRSPEIIARLRMMEQSSNEDSWHTALVALTWASSDLVRPLIARRLTDDTSLPDWFFLADMTMKDKGFLAAYGKRFPSLPLFKRMAVVYAPHEPGDPLWDYVIREAQVDPNPIVRDAASRALKFKG